MWIFLTFSSFLFYCRFAEISKLPDNNTNIAIYHMYSLRCSGTEKNIEHCSYNWGLRTCTDKSAIHISCKTQIRLSNSSGVIASGRLEIHYNGQWGTMCADNFDENEGRVACRMLGFDDRQAMVSQIDSNGIRFIKDDLYCTGEEDDISLCTFQRKISSSCSNRAVWLNCRIPVQLVDGKRRSEGRLELLHAGKWITVCDQNFDQNTAMIVCRSLGYNYMSPEIYTSGYFGKGQSYKIVDGICCTGAETFLGECKITTNWDQGNCSLDQNIGLSCATNVKLVNGNYDNEGILEVQYNRTWGTVCADNFDIVDARVACSMLGFNNPFPEICNTGSSCFRPTHLTPVFTDVNCTGNELDIAQCSSPLGNNGCRTGDVGIICRTRVKLVDGVNPSEGRIEIEHNNEWGTVCEHHFDESDARVICRMLGYDTVHPSILTNGTFKQGSGKIWINNLQCWGTEDDIGQCQFSSWENSHCNHRHDVGLSCGVSVRLTGGSTYKDGKIEVFHSNQWGSICNDTFTVQDGQVICRMLGLDTE